MSNIKKRTVCIIFIFILWLAIIFTFSAMNANSSSNLIDIAINVVAHLREKSLFLDNLFIKLTEKYSLFYVVRKMAHMFVFCTLDIIAFFLFKHFGFSWFKSAIFSIGCVFIYACSDEFHQLFVSGRSAQISDVMIDTFGGLIGLSISLILFSLKTAVKKILLNFKKINK